MWTLFQLIFFFHSLFKKITVAQTTALVQRGGGVEKQVEVKEVTKEKRSREREVLGNARWEG